MRTSQGLSGIHRIRCKLGKDFDGSHQQVWQRYSGDKLQQEFYKLSQEKGEKIGAFTG